MDNIFKLAREDIRASFDKREYIWMVTIHNLKQAYTQTKLGLLWIPLNKIIFGVALGSLYGTLFKQDLTEYLPYVLTGIIIWQFIAASLSSGMRAYSAYGGILRYFGSPKFLFLLQVQLQQIIEFIMLMPILFGVALLVMIPDIYSLAFLIIGLILVFMNLFWVSGVLSIFSLFYRDIEQLVDTVLRLLFLVTPIIWKVESLSGRAFILEWNPFYHLVEMIRAPLLGQSLNMNVCLVFLVSGIVGNILFFIYFSFQRKKIVYMI